MTQPTVPSSNAPTKPSANGWTAFSILIIVAGLVVLVWHILDKSKKSDPAAILGVIVPAFATIGAAVFGVSFAYQQGQQSGQQQSAGQVDQAQAQGVIDGKQQAAAEIRPRIESLRQSVENVIQPITTNLPSPTGAGHYEFVIPGDEDMTHLNLQRFQIPRTSVEEIASELGGISSLIQHFDRSQPDDQT